MKRKRSSTKTTAAPAVTSTAAPAVKTAAAPDEQERNLQLKVARALWYSKGVPETEEDRKDAWIESKSENVEQAHQIIQHMQNLGIKLVEES